MPSSPTVSGSESHPENAQLSHQLQNGGTDIGAVYLVPALATTTCIKLADYVGCGFAPKTTTGFNGVQATLSNPNAPAEGTSVVYSSASVTAGHLLECNTCSPTTGCHKGGTASIVSVPGVPNKPDQYVHTKLARHPHM